MERPCDACGTAYEAKRPSSKFCSPLCRQRARRNPALIETEPGLSTEANSSVDFGPVETRVSERIGSLEVANLPLAEIALAYARRMDSPRETGSAVAAIGKQLAAVLEDLERAGKRVADPLDELRERRRVKALA